MTALSLAGFGTYDESKHPRGNVNNRGQFASKGGVSDAADSGNESAGASGINRPHVEAAVELAERAQSRPEPLASEMMGKAQELRGEGGKGAAAGGDPTKSEAFKSWFGDWESDPQHASKIVTSGNQPLRLFHGTDQEFSEFDSTKTTNTGNRIHDEIYFTDDPTVAAAYSKRLDNDPHFQDLLAKEGKMRGAWEKATDDLDKSGGGTTSAGWGDIRTSPEVDAAFANYQKSIDAVREHVGSDVPSNPGANIKPAYLNLRNPLIVDAGGQSWNEVNAPAVKQALKNGNDGVVVRNVLDHANPHRIDPINVYIAFKPNQIKSTIGNRGTFDPREADIRLSAGGRWGDDEGDDYALALNCGTGAGGFQAGNKCSRGGHQFVVSKVTRAGMVHGRAAGEDDSVPPVELGHVSEFTAVGSLADAPLPEFAAKVKALADGLPQGFGDNKVLIADAFTAAHAADPALTPAEFKSRLKAANNAGHIELSRADLTSRFHPDDLRASSVNLAPGRAADAPDEVGGGGNTAEFIVVPSRARRQVRGAKE